MPRTIALERQAHGLHRLVGNTPLLAIHYGRGGKTRTVYAKSEQLNLTGSIKDRMALHIIEQAYRDGRLAATRSPRRPAGTPGSRSPRSAARLDIP
jgi:threonine dehydratase